MARPGVLARILVFMVFSNNVNADVVGMAIPAGGRSLAESLYRFEKEISPPPLQVTPPTDSLSSPPVFRALSQLKVEREIKLRGAKEAKLYKSISQSVVLVATKGSLGSGSLISDGGEILTNWHVIRGFTEVGVIFKPKIEGKELKDADIRRAKVIMFDEVRDLALLQVSDVPKGVKAVSLGSMNEINVGIDVHAIGHPTGEAWTYTKGVVSQIRRDYQWTSESRKQHRATVIQTQTPINPGNSGGPLLSDEGKLVGVNSFKSAGEGLNFAVSVQDVMAFLGASSSRLAADVSTKKSESRSSSCPEKPVELFAGVDSEKAANVWSYDSNCDGKSDFEIRVPFDSTKPTSVAFDRNGDGKVDLEVFDVGRDDKFDFSFHDVDHDGKWDLVGFHSDGGLVATRFESYESVIAKTGR
jgi:S1-C subfamily serine protease